MIIVPLHCRVCAHDFAVRVGDILDARRTHCINCGKLVEVPCSASIKRGFPCQRRVRETDKGLPVLPVGRHGGRQGESYGT
jgi:hypothetical protein